MKIRITCDDKYEAQKLASLIYVQDTKETYITSVLNVIENEIVLSIKDKSAHSILLSDECQAEMFVDFIQSVIEKEHKIVATATSDRDVEIIKE